MGRNPRCSSDKELQKGSWTAEEDKILMDFIRAHGEGKWSRVMKETGLRRCGKSCRLRWLNYLRPDIKRGNISSDEEEMVIRLHKLLGNRWSLIAGRLPGRTDNEIKNYWNTTLRKKASQVELKYFQEFSRETQTKTTQSQKPVPPQAPDPIHVPPASNYGFPIQSLGSTEDHLMVDFNLDGEDIRQILESDFSGIEQVYLDGLVTPKPEIEVDDYLNMFEDNATLIGSDFVPLFESGYGEWSEFETRDNDLSTI